jgi:type IV pilus assembly protein PilC
MEGIDINILSKRKPTNNYKKKNIHDLDLYKFFNIPLNFTSSFSDKKKEGFYREIGLLLSAKVDMKNTLEILKMSKPSGKEVNIYENIYQSLIRGNTFATALEQSGKFSGYETTSIMIGEQTGELINIFKELSRFFDMKVKQKRKLYSAITYPLIVVVTSMLAVYFMIKFIVPMFTDIFNRFEGDLPLITTYVIRLSENITIYLKYIIIVLSSILLIIRINKKKRWLKQLKASIILRIPVVKDIVVLLYISRFCQAMALLTRSHTPILQAVKLVKKMIMFHPLEIALDKIEQALYKGIALNKGMSMSEIFDKRIILLTKIAEDTNSLEEVFSNLHDQYSNELEYKLSVVGNFLEPLLIIIVGLFIGIILISMYLPLFQLSSTFF